MNLASVVEQIIDGVRPAPVDRFGVLSCGPPTTTAVPRHLPMTRDRRPHHRTTDGTAAVGRQLNNRPLPAETRPAPEMNASHHNTSISSMTLRTFQRRKLAPSFGDLCCSRLRQRQRVYGHHYDRAPVVRPRLLNNHNQPTGSPGEHRPDESIERTRAFFHGLRYRDPRTGRCDSRLAERWQRSTDTGGGSRPRQHVQGLSRRRRPVVVRGGQSDRAWQTGRRDWRCRGTRAYPRRLGRLPVEAHGSGHGPGLENVKSPTPKREAQRVFHETGGSVGSGTQPFRAYRLRYVRRPRRACTQATRPNPASAAT